ncbi:MAG: hypothetical protein KF850_39120 [Labilithrix sp.]|nr:hypothetical protein [Labilithrix sp.]
MRRARYGLRALSVAASLALAAPLALQSEEASAKSAYESAYGYDRTWNAGMRLVRVDLGLKISEKDEGAGYLLFDYLSPESGKKPVPGSMEFIRSKDTGAVRVVVQIPQMPGYHEQVVVDSLARKLRNEYGDPPKRPTPPAPRDAGADGEAPES